MPIPEVPTIVDAEVVEDPRGGHDLLLATTNAGERVAFGFEVESDDPGIVRVDPGLWQVANEAGASEDDASRFDAVVDARADDWLQALVAHPVSAKWLTRIKEAHPDAHHSWFAQTDYETGGEQGSG